MKLSTKAKYGLIAMVDLAAHYGEGPLSIKAIAEKQQLSEAYLEQLFASLKKEMLIKSVRGPGGGYQLSKKPGEISVGEVIRVLEGPILFSNCSAGDEDYICDRKIACPTRGLWNEINECVNDIIDHRMLSDLVAKQ